MTKILASLTVALVWAIAFAQPAGAQSAWSGVGNSSINQGANTNNSIGYGYGPVGNAAARHERTDEQRLERAYSQQGEVVRSQAQHGSYGASASSATGYGVQQGGQGSASSTSSITIDNRTQYDFKIIGSKIVRGGTELTVWTNLPQFSVTNNSYGANRPHVQKVFVPDTKGRDYIDREVLLYNLPH